MKLFLNLSDEDLMKKYQQGDYMAFEILYSRHQSRVYAYLSKRLASPDLVNEVFQNIFLKLHKQRSRYLDKFLFVKFLYTICRSELLDFYKKKKIDTRPFFEEAFISSNVNKGSNSRNVSIADGSLLSVVEKKAVDLRYYSDADFTQISEALNTSVVNARKIISRAIKKLRQKHLKNK